MSDKELPSGPEGTHDAADVETTHASTRGELAEPIADPGLPAHEPRPTDVDPRAEKRAERQVATLFLLSMVCTVLFGVSYFAVSIGNEKVTGEEGSGVVDTFLGMGASTVAMGGTLGLALLLVGIGVIQWARKLMGDHEIVEMRHPARSSDEDRETTLAALRLGGEESGIGRRPLVRNTLVGAMSLFGLAAIIPLRDLGTLPGDSLEHTVWKPEDGMKKRIVNDVTGLPMRPSDLEIGQLVNAEPEGLVHVSNPREGVEYLEGVDLQVAKTKAAVIVVRMEPDDITFSKKSPENWAVEGILCYSKICTHVGCPISLWEQQTHHLLCPCHQSTFDLADAGKVVFGPAARALPQLPIEVDNEGYLIASSDFKEPVGPSYWERDSE